MGEPQRPGHRAVDDGRPKPPPPVGPGIGTPVQVDAVYASRIRAEAARHPEMAETVRLARAARMRDGRWRIGDQDADARLLQQVRREAWRHPGVEPPTAAHLAMMLHALADHTVIQMALHWDREPGPWPEATSVGRFLHALGDLMDEVAFEERSDG